MICTSFNKKPIVDLSSGNEVRLIAAGYSHNLIVNRTRAIGYTIFAQSFGNLIGWGENTHNQTDTHGLFEVRYAEDILDIACGDGFNIVLKTNDGYDTPKPLLGWGDDTYDQITDIPSDTDIAKISAGKDHCLALKSNGTMLAWGNNLFNKATALTGAYSFIAAGENHNAAIKTDGTLVCWGNNSNNQCTVPTVDDEGNPVTYTFQKVAVGTTFTLGLKTDGGLIAFGGDSYNQVTDVPDGNDYTDIACCGDVCLVLKSNGSLVAWGNDTYGQISNAPTTRGFTKISAGQKHCLALQGKTVIKAWGDNSDGQCDVPIFGPKFDKHPAIDTTFYRTTLSYTEDASGGEFAVNVSEQELSSGNTRNFIINNVPVSLSIIEKWDNFNGSPPAGSFVFDPVTKTIKWMNVKTDNDSYDYSEDDFSGNPTIDESGSYHEKCLLGLTITPVGSPSVDGNTYTWSYGYLTVQVLERFKQGYRYIEKEWKYPSGIKQKIEETRNNWGVLQTYTTEYANEKHAAIVHTDKKRVITEFFEDDYYNEQIDGTNDRDAYVELRIWQADANGFSLATNYSYHKNMYKDNILEYTSSPYLNINNLYHRFYNIGAYNKPAFSLDFEAVGSDNWLSAKHWAQYHVFVNDTHLRDDEHYYVSSNDDEFSNYLWDSDTMVFKDNICLYLSDDGKKIKNVNGSTFFDLSIIGYPFNQSFDYLQIQDFLLGENSKLYLVIKAVVLDNVISRILVRVNQEGQIEAIRRLAIVSGFFSFGFTGFTIDESGETPVYYALMDCVRRFSSWGTGSQAYIVHKPALMNLDNFRIVGIDESPVFKIEDATQGVFLKR